MQMSEMVTGPRLAQASEQGELRMEHRPATACARSWTGRSALSCATDSALPHLVTAGTRRTRVSEMRLPGAGARAARRSMARVCPPPAITTGTHGSTRMADRASG